jgi:hypothetical protein
LRSFLTACAFTFQFTFLFGFPWSLAAWGFPWTCLLLLYRCSSTNSNAYQSNSMCAEAFCGPVSGRA